MDATVEDRRTRVGLTYREKEKKHYNASKKLQVDNTMRELVWSVREGGGVNRTLRQKKKKKKKKKRRRMKKRERGHYTGLKTY
jgi:hypothetical protein